MSVVDSTGHGGDELMAELEQLWGRRAIAPAHDRQRDGWLIGASVLALTAIGCVLAGWSAGDPGPLIAAGVAMVLGVLAAARHRHRRSCPVPGRPR